MRYLAIDLGDKRTGFAVGDAITRIVTPLEVVEAADRGQLLAQIQRVVSEQLGPARRAGLAEIIVGLPLNMDGSEGPAAKAAREFGAKIAESTGHTVRYVDERLSSVQADWEMSRSGLTRGEKKARRDARAAAAILRDYLGTLPSAGAGNRNDPGGS